MKIADLKQSKYLSKDDCTPPILVTIAGCEKRNLAMETQPAEIKPVLLFQESTAKPMVLNPINTDLLMMIYPVKDTDEWIGKKVVLYNDPTISFGGRLTGGIRIRAPKKLAAPSAPAPAPSETDGEEDPFGL